MYGVLCSLIVNYSMGAPKEPAKAADYMPSEIAKRHLKGYAESAKRTPQEKADRIRMALESLGRLTKDES